jgi:hypothetical protein
VIPYTPRTSHSAAVQTAGRDHVGSMAILEDRNLTCLTIDADRGIHFNGQGVRESGGFVCGWRLSVGMTIVSRLTAMG